MSSQTSSAQSQMVPSTVIPPSPITTWTGWSENTEMQVVASGETAVGTTARSSGVMARKMVKSVQASPTSGGVVAGPVNGQAVATPNVSGSLKVISIGGGGK